MSISTQQSGDVTILSPSGAMTINGGAVQFRGAGMVALEGSAQKIVVNLSQVTTIDSSGLGELVSSYTTVTNRGGRLKLAAVPPKISDLLMITRLITVFEVYETEAEAVSSFS